MPVHLIGDGDTPSRIARRYGVPDRWLYHANNYFDFKEMRPGRRIYIPEYKYKYYDYPSQWGRYIYRDGLRYEILTGRRRFRYDEEVPVIFSYCNLSETPRRLRYDDARLYDFVALHGGVELWRWSDGYKYDGGSRTMLLQPGECRTLRADWDLRDRWGYHVNNGRYYVRAYDRSRELKDRYVDTEIEVLSSSTNRDPCPKTNMLINPGLEDWSDRYSPMAWSGQNLHNTTRAHSGRYAAELGTRTTNRAVLSQTMNADLRRTYRVEFWAMENVRSGQNGNFDLNAAIFAYDNDDHQIGRVDPVYKPKDLPNNTYRKYSFETGTLPAGTRRIELRFIFQPRSGNESNVRIDDVVLTCIR